MKQSGFTLVELAIVITIIGLLIGGVLKGQELLSNARVLSVSNQLKAYETAYTTFKDIYKGRPGDLLEARNLITGCTAANSCVNGNGDGNIGTSDVPAYAVSTEQGQFWKQLSLANLITGVDPSASTEAYGKSHPANPIHGGYLVNTTTNAANADFQANNYGHIIIGWIADFNADFTSGGYKWEVLPLYAWQIDTKLDDGKPHTGIVRAGSPPVNGGPCEADSSGVLHNYNPAVSNVKCEFHYILEN